MSSFLNRTNATEQPPRPSMCIVKWSPAAAATSGASEPDRMISPALKRDAEACPACWPARPPLRPDGPAPPQPRPLPAAAPFFETSPCARQPGRGRVGRCVWYRPRIRRMMRCQPPCPGSLFSSRGCGNRRFRSRALPIRSRPIHHRGSRQGPEDRSFSMKAISPSARG